MYADEAAKILKSLVDGRDPSSGEELPSDTVYQRAIVIRALLLGQAALEDSLARGKRRAHLPERVGAAWSLEEDERLRSAFQAGRSIAGIALDHRRTPNAIQARLERLKLVSPDERTTFLRYSSSEGSVTNPRRRRSRRSSGDPGELSEPSATGIKET